MPEPISPRGPSGADIADWVRHRIRIGRFVPGQRLVEVDLIRQTGASRSKVREALKSLEGEGLVVIEEYRGASVRHSSIDEVRQIYRARMALEGIAAHDFTLNADRDCLAQLQSLQDQLDASVHARAPDLFGRLNNEWHRLIIAGSGNKVIADHLQRLNVPIHRLLFQSFYDEARLQTANRDHQAMLALILAGDAEGAERAMRAHIAAGFDTLVRIESEFYT